MLYENAYKKEEYKKIILLSCIRLNNGKYKISYCLDYVISNQDFKGLTYISYVVNDTKIKYLSNKYFGKWLRAEFNCDGHILHLSNYKE